MKQTAKIFLCYAKEDKPQVERFYQKLKEAGFDPWMDKVDLVGGEEWRPAIQKAIRESHFFIPCVSKHWIPTDWRDRKRFIRREIQTALDVLPELQQGDIYIIPIRLEECEVPDNLSLFQWIDYFREDGWVRLVKSIHKGMERLKLIKPVRLRSRPLDNVSIEYVDQMLRKYDLFDKERHWAGKGLHHQYELIERDGEKVVADHTTGLTWQQSGSSDRKTYAGAKQYVRELNKNRFAGYNYWRLPTLEEAMSLMEPLEMNNSLFIDPVFDQAQQWIWTADKESASSAWSVDFRYGSCRHSKIGYIRLLRSLRTI